MVATLLKPAVPFSLVSCAQVGCDVYVVCNSIANRLSSMGIL